MNLEFPDEPKFIEFLLQEEFCEILSPVFSLLYGVLVSDSKTLNNKILVL